MNGGPLRWRTLVIAVAALVSITAVAWTVNPPSYLTNDDVTIRLGLEGTLVPGQPPNGFVLMTHAALGWAIVAVQSLMPALPLWDVVITGTLFVAAGIILVLCGPLLGRDWVGRIAALAAFTAMMAPLLYTVQFTFGATLAGGAATMLAFSETNARKPRTPVLVAALLLALAGMLVRPMAATAGALAAAVLLLPAALLAPPRWGGRVWPIAAGVAVLALFGVVQAVDTALYALDPEWDAYHRYNWMLAQFFEWGGALSDADLAAMRGVASWTSNDWLLLSRWLGVDPTLHGFARVSNAFDAHMTVFGWDASVGAFVQRLAAVDVDTLVRLTAQSAIPLGIAGAVAGGFASLRGTAAIGATVVIFYGFCIAIEAAFKELPFRLLAPLQVCLVAAILMTAQRFRRNAPPFAALLAGGILVAVAGHETATAVAAMAANHRHSLQVDREVADLMQLSPSLLVLHADAFPAERWWRPFRRPPSNLPAIRLGDNNQNPLLQRFLTATGRQPLLRAVCKDASILIVSEADRLVPATAYLAEHFNNPVEWVVAYDASFTAWRCVPGPATPLTERASIH